MAHLTPPATTDDPAVAVDTPYLLTSDPDEVLSFAARLGAAERCPVENVHQLLLGADLRTMSGGLRYTWPAITQLCVRLSPGAADVVAALSGRRRSYTPNPSAASAVFNLLVQEQYSRVGHLLLLVGTDERLIYRATAMAGRVRPSAPEPHLQALFSAARSHSFEVVRAFGPLGQIDIAFALPRTIATLPLPVSPAVLVRPYPAQSRVAVYPAARVGRTVLPGRPVDTGRRPVYRPTTWAEAAMSWLGETEGRLARTLPLLAGVRLPGSNSDTLTPPVLRWLRARGVNTQVGTAMVRRLVSGRYTGSQLGEVSGDPAAGVPGEWTAADLLLAIVATVDKYASRVAAITALGRVGFDLATGEAEPVFV